MEEDEWKSIGGIAAEIIEKLRQGKTDD